MSAVSFSDESAASFRASARDWLSSHAGDFQIPDGATEAERVEIRRRWERQLAAGGFNCLSWPKQFGGRELGPIEDFIFAEECIKVNAPEPLGRIGRLLTAPGLIAHGTAEQQQRLLPKIMHCDEIWCQGFSEPNAGSDLANLRTSARKVGDHYVINGQKIWTTFGHYADRCILLARTGEPGGRHNGLTMFALNMRQPGVTVRQIRQISGSADFNEVFFDDAKVEASDVIGSEGQGWQVALTILSAERGAGFAALRLHTIHDQLTLLGTAPEDAATLAKLNEYLTRFEVLRWQAMRAVERMAADRNALPSSSILKLVWSELEQDVVRTGFQTSSNEHLAKWRFYEMQARSQTIASGTSEIQRNIISERVLGLPR